MKCNNIKKMPRLCRYQRNKENNNNNSNKNKIVSPPTSAVN